MIPTPTTEERQARTGLFWDDLLFEAKCHLYNSKIGTLQVRCVVRGENLEDVQKATKAIMRLHKEIFSNPKATDQEIGCAPTK